MDEFDSIATRRGSKHQESSFATERIVTQLLTEMDGMKKYPNVIVIASTNRPNVIDPAIMRTGRIDKLIYIPAPDNEARKKIALVHLKRKNLAENIDVNNIAEMIASKTDFYSGSDIEAIVMEAGLTALGKGNDFIEKDDFLKAIEKIPPSYDEDMNKVYENMRKRIKSKIMKDDLSYMT